MLAKLGMQLVLEWLNSKNVTAHAKTVPEAVKDVMDQATYEKSVRYTLDQSRFHQVALSYRVVVLMVILFSGVLPWSHDLCKAAWGESPWAMAMYLFLVGAAISSLSLPLDWFEQFQLEARYGFNTMTGKLWWIDRFKGLALALVLGLPLLALVLQLVEWTGLRWWFWAWAALMGFQMVITVLAPVVILPLFNKFSPLQDENLRTRLTELAERTRFQARSIQVMDGSRRSRHSNAFFTGFGRFRKIVLFDTLIEQLSPVELEAVLAHEIGHFRKKHIPKLLALSALASLAGFFTISLLAQQEWFYRAFGFDSGSIVPALLLFALLSGVVTFWFSPLANWWSRRYEFQADAFASQVMNETDSLAGALRKLAEKNLSNLTPHPAYSCFYYSHPTLLEREAAFKKRAPTAP